jgi:hypothetical protein
MPFGPDQTDLHINAPLTNVSVRFASRKERFVADKVFPAVPVDKKSDVFWKYGKSDWFRTDAQKRAPGTESAGTGWNATTATYRCEPLAVHKDIDDQTRANADSNWNLDKVNTEFVTNQLRIRKEIDFASSFLKSGVWTTNWTGVAGTPGGSQFKQFNDATSDPIGFFEDLHISFEELTGESINKVVMGARVLKALKQHPDVIDRIKYTQKGLVTTDMLAAMLNVGEIVVPRGVKATGPQINDAVAQDAANTLGYIADSKGVLAVYTPETPSIDTPAAGYTFNWKGYVGGNTEGIAVRKFRMDHLRASRIEAEMTYDMKVVAPDCGVWLGSAVA